MVAFGQIIVALGQAVRSERLVVFGASMHVQLEFSEHGLAHQSATNVFELLHHQMAPQGGVLAGFEQVVNHQRFVEGRGHFGHKNRVIAVVVGLGAPGVVRVHGMAQLVRQGKDVVEAVLVVEQNIGGGGV